MPCLEYLSQVRRAKVALEALGATALAVSRGADFQARAIEDAGSWFPLLIDPHRHVAHALGVRRIGIGWLDPLGWWTYVRAFARGARQGHIADPLQAPGLALVDARAVARYVHRGRTLGDYPPLSEVVAGCVTSRRLLSNSPSDSVASLCSGMLPACKERAM